MAELLTRPKPGTPLALIGGLPPRRTVITAASAFVKKQPDNFVAAGGPINPSLASALRPQATNQWMLPYLAALTPQYIEMLLRGMLYGNHAQGMELFTVMMDSSPEIASCVKEWTDGVLSTGITFEPYTDAKDETSDLAQQKCDVVRAALLNMRPQAEFDENGLRNLMRDISFGRFHGISVQELDWHDTHGTGERYIRTIPGLGEVQCLRSSYWVHPICYAFDVNGRLGLNITQSEIADATKNAKQNKTPSFYQSTSTPRPNAVVPFPERNFIIGIDKAKTGSVLGGSCLRALAWLWCAQNFCGDWLLHYAQIFGMPTRWVNYEPSAAGMKSEMLQMLQDMGSSLIGIFPAGAEVKYIEAHGGGENSPQAFVYHLASDMIRKVILHQTMMGGSHGSASSSVGKAGMQSEAEGSKESCIQSGREFVESVINLQVIPYILVNNYGPDGDLEAPTLKLMTQEVGTAEDATAIATLVNAGLNTIPVNWVHRRFHIPMPKDGEDAEGPEETMIPTQVQMQDKQMEQQQAQQEAQMEMQQQQQDADRQAQIEIEKARSKNPQPAQPGEEPEPGEGSAQPLEEAPAQSKAFRKACLALQAANSDTANLTKAFKALPKNMQDQLKAMFALDDNGVPMTLPAKTYFCPKCKKPNAKYRLMHEDTDMEENVLHCPDCDYWSDGPVKAKRSRRAIQAASASINPDTKPADTALLESIQPMLDRLEAIKAVKDSVTRKKLLAKFLRDHGTITAAILHDPALSRVLTPDVVGKFLSGLKGSPK